MANKTTLRQQVYEQIKQEIMNCRLAPGEVLSENRLLSRFEASKTPIREALTSLVQERLVEYFPNRGFMVTSVSVADIQEIFDARIFFETELFRLAVKNMTEREIDAMERQYRAQAGHTAPSTAEDFLRSNIDFHLALAAAAHNRRLLWYYGILMNEAQRLFYMDLTLHRDEFKWAHGHQEILRALRKRDEPAGRKAIREALESARRRVLEG